MWRMLAASLAVFNLSALLFLGPPIIAQGTGECPRQKCFDATACGGGDTPLMEGPCVNATGGEKCTYCDGTDKVRYCGSDPDNNKTQCTYPLIGKSYTCGQGWQGNCFNAVTGLPFYCAKLNNNKVNNQCNFDKCNGTKPCKD